MQPPPGIELSRRFYEELVGPWLARDFPGLPHAAALLGYGSELFGFDDELSRDHSWGPRVGIYVQETDFATYADAVVAGFAVVAPESFLGVPTSFHWPRAAHRDEDVSSDVRHGLEVWTLGATTRALLALEVDEPRDNRTWLGLSEQRLLTVTAGAVFRDDDGRLTALRKRLAAFPLDVQLYKLACQWRRIAEEQAFVGRTGRAGDDLGSRVIAARLVRDAMRLAFLIEGRYAPYSKWFGTAFTRLPCAADLLPVLERVVASADWKAREAALSEAYLALGKLHKARGLPGDFEPSIGPFFDRPFRTINAEDIWCAIAGQIADPVLRSLPVIGSLDQVVDSTAALEAPARARRAMAGLLGDSEAGPRD